MKKDRKVALLGGTFNPIHIGHLAVAEETARALGYERVVFVPSFRPAHKNLPENDDPRHRLAMVRLATRSNRAFVVEDCEIRRRGTSYTMDTIEFLRDRFAIDGRIGLVIGDDLVPGFGTWKNVDELLEAVHVIIARRTETDRVDFPGPHSFVDNVLVPVSSSDIRERIRRGRAFRYLVPEAVFGYIERHGLYRNA